MLGEFQLFTVVVHYVCILLCWVRQEVDRK